LPSYFMYPCHQVYWDDIWPQLQELAGQELEQEAVILITSAEVPDEIKKRLDNESKQNEIPEVVICDRAWLLAELSKYNQIVEQYFEPVRKRAVIRKYWWILSLLGGIASILGLIFSIGREFIGREKPLEQRIILVEEALTKMKDLEGYINKIKKDMEKTQEENTQIRAEYDEVQKLKKMTDEEIRALRKALAAKSIWSRVFDYLFGLILGVASSIIGALIYSRIKRRRALR